MKKITPFKSSKEAIKKLDNGGRFYNILTKADDGIISKEELGKVGGLFYDKQQMILFFELSISKLKEEKKDKVISKLDNILRSNYQIHKAQHLSPSEADAKGKISANAIIEGIPKLIESKNDFNGFIMIPIMTGKVTTLSMIPIIDQYNVYEIRDENTDDFFVIAHSKGSEQLPEKRIKIAGTLKVMKTSKEEKKGNKKFLEAVYWME